MIFFIFIITFLNMVNLFSQNAVLGPESSNWFFGENAGITFNSLQNIPKPIQGSLVTEEGCASVSDSEGNLLFYASGETIWNRNHNVMKNASSLPGGHSSTQAVLILQQPGVNDIFYVVNTENLGGSLTYSIVDMKEDNGLGGVVSRNNLIAEDIGEKLSSAYHSNNFDVWILAKDKNTHMFRAFLLNNSGIQTSSVDSYLELGFDLGHKYSSMGYLNFSPYGDKIGVASYSGFQIELYDFDRATGKVNNPIILNVPDKLNTYGICFSPDASKLYATYYDYDSFLAQYDLTDYDSSSIINSRKIIAEYHDGYAIGAIQAGPDEKLYISRYKNDYLSVINHPNELGANCDYDSNGVYLDGKKTRLGLPNFTYVNRYNKAVPDPDFHNVLFEVKSLEGKPGDNQKKIQVFGKVLNEDVKVNNIQFTAILEFDATSFLPAQNENVVSSSIINTNRVLNFQLNNLTLDTSEKLVIEFPGTILLGKKEINQLRLSDIDMRDTIFKTFIKNGILVISDVCLTSYRKVLATFAKLNILNNPVKDILTIKFIPEDKGDYTYHLYALDGSLVQTGQIDVLTEHSEVESEIPIDRLSPGFYSITIKYLDRSIRNSFIKL